MIDLTKQKMENRWSWLFPGSSVVEHVTHHLKIKGLNPSSGTRGDKMILKHESSLQGHNLIAGKQY
jgi:hypothetical protein